MPISRRDLCAMLPAALLPAIIPSEAAAADANVLPSAMYPFEKLTPHKSETRHAAPASPPRSLRNVVDS